MSLTVSNELLLQESDDPSDERHLAQLRKIAKAAGIFIFHGGLRGKSNSEKIQLFKDKLKESGMEGETGTVTKPDRYDSDNRIIWRDIPARFVESLRNPLPTSDIIRRSGSIELWEFYWITWLWGTLSVSIFAVVIQSEALGNIFLRCSWEKRKSQIAGISTIPSGMSGIPWDGRRANSEDRFSIYYARVMTRIWHLRGYDRQPWLQVGLVWKKQRKYGWGRKRRNWTLGTFWHQVGLLSCPVVGYAGNVLYLAIFNYVILVHLRPRETLCSPECQSQ